MTSSASSSAKADCSGTTTTAKYSVLRSDFQKRGSWKSRVKLSSPTNWIDGEISRALVKASTKASVTGMKKNTMSRMTDGLTISAPVNASRRSVFLSVGACASAARVVVRFVVCPGVVTDMGSPNVERSAGGADVARAPGGVRVSSGSSCCSCSSRRCPWRPGPESGSASPPDTMSWVAFAKVVVRYG